MLGKLIRHEWKSTYRMGGLMLLITLMVTFLGWFSFQSPMWRQIGEDSSSVSFGPLDFLSIIVLIMYVFMLVGIAYAIQIYLGIHFYKTMYTDQGYLTHTLPVGKHQLLGSKILVSGLWLLIVYIAVLLSCMIVMGSMGGAVLPADTWSDFWKELSPVLREFFDLLDLNYGLYLVILILSAIASPFVSVTIMFGAVTVGQLFNRARALMAILCYLGVCMVNGIIASVVQSLVAFSAWGSGAMMNASTYSSLAVQLAAAVLLYFASYQIITKRLNME